LYPWARNWSQIFVYEWQNYQSVDKILGDIRIVEIVTRGIPKVVVLPGLQKAEPAMFRGILIGHLSVHFATVWQDLS
jgi:hypothetical protein